MSETEVPVARPGKRKGTEVVEAFGTTWRVVSSRLGIDRTEHEDEGWYYGVSEWGRYAQQVAVRKEAADAQS